MFYKLELSTRFAVTSGREGRPVYVSVHLMQGRNPSSFLTGIQPHPLFLEYSLLARWLARPFG